VAAWAGCAGGGGWWGAGARQPVPVTVSVSGGNITAAVSQAAERDNRRN